MTVAKKTLMSTKSDDFGSEIHGNLIDGRNVHGLREKTLKMVLNSLAWFADSKNAITKARK